VKRLARGVIAVMLAGCAVFAVIRASAIREPAQWSEASLSKLASNLGAAVNDADPAAAQALTADGVRNDYRWLLEWRESGGSTGPWHAGVLRWPGNGSETDTVLLHVSRPQVTQSTFDHLYEVRGSRSRAQIGPEVPETELVGARVVAHEIDVAFSPNAHTVALLDRATVRRQYGRFSFALYRLNENYRVTELLQDGKPVPFVRTGGFLVAPRLTADSAVLTVRSTAALPRAGESFVADDEAAVTAYWYLHTARLPATSTVTIHAPAGWSSIGNGDKVAEAHDARQWSSTWRNVIPVCYLTAVAGRYHETSAESGSVRVSAWLLTPSDTRAEQICRTTAQAISYFTKAFSPYPYQAYTVVESRIFPPALEGYSFMFAGSGNLPDVIPHEVSHTWWGGLVPCTYTHSMWNEAFATYSESLFRRFHVSGISEDPGAGAAAAANSLPTRPSLLEVKDAMHPAHSAIGYEKGSRVLAQLERWIGSDAMLRAMKDFVARHPHGEAADWPDFVAAAVRVAGPEAGEFLWPWLREGRFPEYGLHDVRVTEDGANYRVQGFVKASAPVHYCLAPLRVIAADGPTDTAVRVRAVSVPFSITCHSAPRRIELDPQGVMLRRDGTSMAFDLTSQIKPP